MPLCDRMDPRHDINVIEYIDWTTGQLLLTNDGTNALEVFPEQQHQQQQHQDPGVLPTAVVHHLPNITVSSSSSRYSANNSYITTASTSSSSSERPFRYDPAGVASYSSSESVQFQPHPSSISNGYRGGNSSSDFVKHRQPFPGFQSGVPVATSNPACGSQSSSSFRANQVGSRREPIFVTMANRSRTSSKSRDRVSHKRGTSVMSEPIEDGGGRSWKFQRSHSSLVDYDDVQSNFTLRDASHDEDEDDGPDDSSRRLMSPSPTPSDEQRSVCRGGGGGRQNHSEIEKRRRDKMNTYITELSRVVPMCITMSHKLDKLTVLRMAVQHLKTIRGVIHSYTEGDYKPAFLSDEELKRLILQSADGFVFVADSNRGRMLYVSESVSQVLNYSQGDLLGQSWFDILHPKDVAKVKEQLSSPTATNANDVPQGLSRLCPGARRSFFCRMKCGRTAPAGSSSKGDQAELSATPMSSKHRKSQNLSKEKKFVVVHCTGYLKSWAPAKIGVDDQDTEGDVDACNLSCLVAVGRLQPPSLGSNPSGSEGTSAPVVEFISRHTIDGKFLFVDQRATLLLGLLPQELLGTSMYEYFHVDDIVSLAESHKAALQTVETVTTVVYRFRIKEGSFIRLQSRWKSFRNPWTKDIEFLVAKNACFGTESTEAASPGGAAHSFNAADMFYSAGSGGMAPSNNTSNRVRFYSMELEASKIGQTVADEVLQDSHRSRSSASGLSSTAIRSPGSILSGSMTTSPFSNIGSPLDSDAGYGPSALSPPYTNEDLRRSVLGEGTNNGSGHGSLMRSLSNQDHHQQLLSSPSRSNNEGNEVGGNGRVPIRNNHLKNDAASLINEAGLHAEEDMMEVIGGLMMDQSQSSSRETNGSADGNDEAAMAVVMSLLEADAGLGGPVDFSGLPWPLP